MTKTEYLLNQVSSSEKDTIAANNSLSNEFYNNEPTVDDKTLYTVDKSTITPDSAKNLFNHFVDTELVVPAVTNESEDYVTDTVVDVGKTISDIGTDLVDAATDAADKASQAAKAKQKTIVIAIVSSIGVIAIVMIAIVLARRNHASKN